MTIAAAAADDDCGFGQPNHHPPPPIQIQSLIHPFVRPSMMRGKPVDRGISL